MNREKFKAEANETIDNIFSKIEKLEHQKDRLNSNVKHKYDAQLATLKEQKSELKEQLENMQEKSEDNWEKAKEVFSESMKHYKAGFAELSKLFK